MKETIEQFDHPSWFSVGSVAVGYGIFLAILLVLLFVIPFVVFSAI